MAKLSEWPGHEVRNLELQFPAGYIRPRSSARSVISFYLRHLRGTLCSFYYCYIALRTCAGRFRRDCTVAAIYLFGAWSLQAVLRGTFPLKLMTSTAVIWYSGMRSHEVILSSLSSWEKPPSLTTTFIQLMFSTIRTFIYKSQLLSSLQQPKKFS